MANIRGSVDTSKFESGIKKYDVRDFIFQLEKDEAPFVSLLSKVRKEKTVDAEFSWFEDRMIGKYTKVNNGAGYDADDTSIVVDDADIFTTYDVVKNVNTGEVMLVTGVTVGTNTLTVTRGWGSTAAAAITDNDDLFRLGNAQAEGYTAPSAISTTKTKLSNYIQLFSKTVELTDTANAVATWGGKRRDYERKKGILELKRDIESQFLWGEKKLDTTGSKPRYQTAGVWSFLYGTAPHLSAGGALTQSTFDGWLKNIFAYGGKERFLFAGNLPIQQINGFANSAIRVDAGVQKTYGIRFMTYTSAFGDVHLVYSQQFVGPYAGHMVCLDVKELVYRYLDGLDLTMALDVQAKNSHSKQDEYSGQIGIEIHSALRHGTASGVTAGA